ncbi:hypothetical protein Tco_1120026 [Tanacetum coccineum]
MLGKLSQFSKELKQSEAKGTKEWGNGQKRQAPSHLDDSTMGEGSKAKGHLKLRPKVRSQMVPATTSLIGFSGETIWPIGQISLLVTIPTQWNNRQNGHKKDPCRTIHGTWNVKIPDKGRNDNDTKQQSHPDGMFNDLQTLHTTPRDQSGVEGEDKSGHSS